MAQTTSRLILLTVFLFFSTKNCSSNFHNDTTRLDQTNTKKARASLLAELSRARASLLAELSRYQPAVSHRYLPQVYQIQKPRTRQLWQFYKSIGRRTNNNEGLIRIVLRDYLQRQRDGKIYSMQFVHDKEENGNRRFSSLRKQDNSLRKQDNSLHKQNSRLRKRGYSVQRDDSSCTSECHKCSSDYGSEFLVSHCVKDCSTPISERMTLCAKNCKQRNNRCMYRCTRYLNNRYISAPIVAERCDSICALRTKDSCECDEEMFSEGFVCSGTDDMCTVISKYGYADRLWAVKYPPLVTSHLLARNGRFRTEKHRQMLARPPYSLDMHRFQNFYSLCAFIMKCRHIAGGSREFQRRCAQYRSR